jgi:hypothetical protein
MASCPHCVPQATFQYKSQLKKHLESHASHVHPTRICSACNVSFSSRALLTSHLSGAFHVNAAGAAAASTVSTGTTMRVTLVAPFAAASAPFSAHDTVVQRQIAASAVLPTRCVYQVSSAAPTLLACALLVGSTPMEYTSRTALRAPGILVTGARGSLRPILARL